MGTDTLVRPQTHTHSSFVLFVLAFVAALMLAPPFAFAADPAGSATLQVSRGVDDGGKVVVDLNKTYDFYPDATIEDVLKAAVEHGDLASFELSDYGFPATLTFTDGAKVENAADWSMYWSSAIDTNTAAEEFNTGNYSTIKLEDGKTYQVVMDSYPSVITDWGVFGQATKAEGVVAGTAPADDSAETPQKEEPQAEEPQQEEPQAEEPQQEKPSEDGNPTSGSEQAEPEKADNQTTEQTPTKVPSALTQEQATSLFDNIAASYAGTKLDWNAMDVGRAGITTADTEALLENARAAFAQPDSGSLQRSILALTANGLDATKVASGDTTVDLVAALAKHPDAHSDAYASIPAFTLLAYESGPYTVPEDALLSIAGFKTTLVGLQNADGSYGYGDIDTTAMVITALAPYYNTDTTIKTSIDKALEHIKSQQLADGGFGTKYGDATTSNSSSTAMVVIALSALGLDANKVWESSNNVTPYAALLSFATDDLKAFTYDGTAASDSATEQGFRAMVAYRGFVNSGSPFNVYLDTVKERAIDVPVAENTPGSKDADQQPSSGNTGQQQNTQQASQVNRTTTRATSPAATQQTTTAPAATQTARTADTLPVVSLWVVALCALVLSRYASFRIDYAGEVGRD